MVSRIYKKVLGNFKLEAPKKLFFDELNCLRSKTDSFKRNDENKNKLKVVPKSQVENTTMMIITIANFKVIIRKNVIIMEFVH